MKYVDLVKLYREEMYSFLKLIVDMELLLVFNNDFLTELTADNKLYIPLFTSVSEIKGIKYTRIDSVNIGVIIRDIYSLRKYHAISINPYSDDLIITDSMIKIIKIIDK